MDKVDSERFWLAIDRFEVNPKMRFNDFVLMLFGWPNALRNRRMFTSLWHSFEGLSLPPRKKPDLNVLITSSTDEKKLFHASYLLTRLNTSLFRRMIYVYSDTVDLFYDSYHHHVTDKSLAHHGIQTSYLYDYSLFSQSDLMREREIAERSFFFTLLKSQLNARTTSVPLIQSLLTQIRSNPESKDIASVLKHISPITLVPNDDEGNGYSPLIVRLLQYPNCMDHTHLQWTDDQIAKSTYDPWLDEMTNSCSLLPPLLEVVRLYLDFGTHPKPTTIMNLQKIRTGDKANNDDHFEQRLLIHRLEHTQKWNDIINGKNNHNNGTSLIKLLNQCALQWALTIWCYTGAREAEMIPHLSNLLGS